MLKLLSLVVADHVDSNRFEAFNSALALLALLAAVAVQSHARHVVEHLLVFVLRDALRDFDCRRRSAVAARVERLGSSVDDVGLLTHLVHLGAHGIAQLVQFGLLCSHPLSLPQLLLLEPNHLLLLPLQCGQQHLRAGAFL